MTLVGALFLSDTKDVDLVKGSGVQAMSKAQFEKEKTGGPKSRP